MYMPAYLHNISECNKDWRAKISVLCILFICSKKNSTSLLVNPYLTQVPADKKFNNSGRLYRHYTVILRYTHNNLSDSWMCSSCGNLIPAIGSNANRFWIQALLIKLFTLMPLPNGIMLQDKAKPCSFQLNCMYTVCLYTQYWYYVVTFLDGRSRQRIAFAQSLTSCKPSNRHPVICLRKVKHKFDEKNTQALGTSSVSSEQHNSGTAHRIQHDLSQDDMALMASYMI